MALISQSLHQLNNPAQVPNECGSVNQHIHPDPNHHSCDLCDYKITCTMQVKLVTPKVKWIIYNNLPAPEQIFPVVFQLFAKRGPPSTLIRTSLF